MPDTDESIHFDKTSGKECGKRMAKLAGE